MKCYLRAERRKTCKESKALYPFMEGGGSWQAHSTVNEFDECTQPSQSLSKITGSTRWWIDDWEADVCPLSLTWTFWYGSTGSQSWTSRVTLPFNPASENIAKDWLMDCTSLIPYSSAENPSSSTVTSFKHALSLGDLFLGSAIWQRMVHTSTKMDCTILSTL